MINNHQQHLSPAISQGFPLPTAPLSPPTLVVALCETVHRTTGKQQIIYVQLDGSEIISSYAELLLEAESILAGLRNLGLQPQAQVILQLELNQEIIPAFWGCLLGGFVPVIVTVPPTYRTPSRSLEQLQQIIQQFHQPLIITSAEIAEAKGLAAWSATASAPTKFVLLDQLRNNAPDHAHHPSTPDDVAFFSLTSGSTGVPKAIMLTHRNILSRGRGANILCHCSTGDVILNWLPFDHIGSISDWHLRCIELGCSLVYAPKEYVVGNRLNWLALIDKYRITHSWAPNFAYALVTDALKSATESTWDLSCVQALVIAGEAISAATVEEFLTALAPYGLARTVLHPAFGMAEMGSGVSYFLPTATAPIKFHTVLRASLTEAIVRCHPADADSITFADLGPPIPGISMRIVDTQNHLLPEETVGHLQVKGDAVSPGYYQNPAANEQVFLADGWFDTGDFGFMVEGRLVVTGRAKESIIINGANFYSREIEDVVESVPGVAVSFTVACAVRQVGRDGEKLAIFFHTPLTDEQHLRELLKQIQHKVVRQIGIKPDYLLPLSKAAIPKTAIGKIQRTKLAQRFEAGEFDGYLHLFGTRRVVDTSLQEMMYEMVWLESQLQPQALEPETHAQVNDSGVWLIFAPCSNAGASLSNANLGQQLALALKGDHVLVYAGSAYQQRTLGEVIINPLAPEEFQRLLAPLGSRLRGIVYLWMLNHGDSAMDTIHGAMDWSLLSLLHLVQALTQSSLAPRVWLVTQGAQAVTAHECVTFQQAPLWGLGKVIALEHPELAPVCVDLAPTSAAPATVMPSSEQPALQAIATLADELLRQDTEHLVAYRGNRRYVARLTRNRGKESPSTNGAIDNNRPQPVRESGSYLITGGLGALGLQMADWLAAQGAQYLVLASRNTRNGTQEMIDQISALGAQVLVIQADVSKQEDVERLLAACPRPLRGIIHAAGVADDGVLRSQTSERFKQVMAPKVQGAWNLHTVVEKVVLDQQAPLDFFVLFSSVASLIGWAGQGTYAAANAFLDGLAHYRRACGLPALSINWSPWGGVGMAAHLESTLKAQGVTMIAPKQGLQALSRLLTQDSAQMGVLSVDWDHYLQRYSSGGRLPFFAALATGETISGEQPNAVALHKKLLTATIPERIALLTNYLNEMVARALRLSPSQLDVQQPFSYLGLDSVAAIELRYRLKTEFDVMLSIADFLDNLSVTTLALQLCKQLDESRVRASPPVLTTGGQQNEDRKWTEGTL